MSAMTRETASLNLQGNNQRGDSAWRKYHPDLQIQLARERLREALTDTNSSSLLRAIETCCNKGIDKEDPDLRKAETYVQVLEAKKKLSDAKATKDANKIMTEVEEIEGSRYYSYMQADVWDAHQLMRRLERLEKLRRDILNLDKNMMSEMRRYHKPPPVIHKVTQAALLLLGYDEERTSDWRECQKLCNPQGQNGLNRKIMMFDIAKLHPEIAARSSQLLELYKLADVQKVSLGASTFYVWAMGTIDERKNLIKTNEGDDSANGNTSDTSAANAQPADVSRQKEILYGIHPGAGQSPKRPRPHKFIHGGTVQNNNRKSNERNNDSETKSDFNDYENGSEY